MKELKIMGNQKFMGMDIPVIEGGFGEGQKVILAKTVAEIHSIRLNDVQDLINKYNTTIVLYFLSFNAIFTLDKTMIFLPFYVNILID